MNKQKPHAGIEEWRDICGYKGLYQVSDRGRVRRLSAVVRRRDGIEITVPGGMMKPRLKNSGYLFVTLTRKAKRENHYVHHLVAEAFIGPRPAGLDINHKNGLKTDNRAYNLNYMTRYENMKHARRLGLYDNRGEKQWNSKLTAEDVKEIRWAHSMCGLVGRDMAEHFGVSHQTIDDVIQGRSWRHIK